MYSNEKLSNDFLTIEIVIAENSPTNFAYTPEDCWDLMKKNNIEPKRIRLIYPKYSENWNVFAKVDGTLIDNKTGRELYSLYYENKT